MLDTLKKFASSWVAQILLALLILSFAVWGVGDIFNGFRSNVVASVGSTDITAEEYQRQYDLTVQDATRQFGTPITRQMAIQLGLPQQVLGRLVGEATLDSTAGSLGLGMSNDELSRKIVSDPQFHGSSGTFDRGLLAQILQARGYTENDFILALKREYVRAQIGQAFAGGVATPRSYLEAMHEFIGEERDISYIVLAAPADGEIATPDDATLATWFDANKAEFAAPEYRAASYFVLDPKAISRVEDVSDADAQARYDASPQRFATVERRQVQQIVFADRAEADAAALALASGQTFDQLLIARSLKPADVDLGMVRRDQIADPAVAEAAFSLTPGTASGVVDGAFGPVIVRVAGVEPAVVTTFEQVKDTLKQEIAVDRAVAEVNDLRNAIEDARAGGATISEVAAKFNLPVVTVPAVDSTGKGEDGNAVDGLAKPLLTGIFASDVGLENNPVQPERNSFAWFEVTAVTDPRDRTMDEVKDRVLAAWREEERGRLLTERAEALTTRINSGGSLSDTAALAAVPVQTVAKITRVTQPTGDLSSAAVRAIFDTDQGKAAVAEGARPLTSLVMVVTRVGVPPYDATSPAVAQYRDRTDRDFYADLYGIYITQLQSTLGVRPNDALLAQIVGLSSSTQ